MFRSSLIPRLMVFIVVAFSLAVSGCKKEEKAATTPAQTSAAPAAQGGATSYSFEDGVGGWGPRGSVKLEQATDKKHGGNASLKVSGTADKGIWNLAGSPSVILKPGNKYKLTGWMLVDSWDKKSNAPLLKCGISQDGAWKANEFTSPYDLKKSKEWQEVSGTFVAPQGGNITGVISLEKGTQDPITATVYLDDIKLEADQ